MTDLANVPLSRIERCVIKWGAAALFGLLSVIVGLAGWTVVTVQELDRTGAAIAVEMAYMKEALLKGTQDRYHGSDAARDFQRVYDNIGENRRRIKNLEDIHNRKDSR